MGFGNVNLSMNLNPNAIGNNMIVTDTYAQQNNAFNHQNNRFNNQNNAFINQNNAFLNKNNVLNNQNNDLAIKIILN